VRFDVPNDGRTIGGCRDDVSTVVTEARPQERGSSLKSRTLVPPCQSVATPESEAVRMKRPSGL
jgi:hypothetical protein